MDNGPPPSAGLQEGENRRYPAVVVGVLREGEDLALTAAEVGQGAARRWAENSSCTRDGSTTEPPLPIRSRASMNSSTSVTGSRGDNRPCGRSPAVPGRPRPRRTPTGRGCRCPGGARMVRAAAVRPWFPPPLRPLKVRPHSLPESRRYGWQKAEPGACRDDTRSYPRDAGVTADTSGHEKTGRPQRREERRIVGRRAADMRQKRIEKPRRSGRTGRTTDDRYAPYDALDPRDADIVRAKRVPKARRGAARRL